MGSCCKPANNKSSAGAVQVAYKGQTQRWEALPSDWSAVRQRVLKLDPTLKWTTWTLQTKGSPGTDIASQAEYEQYMKGTRQSPHLMVVLAPALSAKPPLAKYQSAVCLLLDSAEFPIGNCVLLSSKLAITSDALIVRREDLGNFSVCVRLGSDVVVKCKKGGLFLKAEELQLVVMELEANPALSQVVPVWVKESRISPSTLDSGLRDKDNTGLWEAEGELGDLGCQEEGIR